MRFENFLGASAFERFPSSTEYCCQCIYGIYDFPTRFGGGKGGIFNYTGNRGWKRRRVVRIGGNRRKINSVSYTTRAAEENKRNEFTLERSRAVVKTFDAFLFFFHPSPAAANLRPEPAPHYAYEFATGCGEMKKKNSFKSLPIEFFCIFAVFTAATIFQKRPILFSTNDNRSQRRPPTRSGALQLCV